MHKRLGFTMVELIIVIVVIGILATIIVVSYNGVAQRSKTVALESDLITAANTLDNIKSNKGSYPASLSAAQSAGLSFTSGITPQYTFFTKTSDVPGHYCLTITKDDVSSHIASGGVPTRGPCVGHTGTAPTDPDEGGNCPDGYIVVPGSSYFNTKSFCVMKYEAKTITGEPGDIFTYYAGLPMVSVSQTSAKTLAESACDNCHLISEAEWMTIAANVLSVPSNWTGGSVGSGEVYRGHSDGTPASVLSASSSDSSGYSGTGQTSGNQRRTLTLTNGQVIWDFAGNVWEWTSGVLPANSGTGTVGDTNCVWKEYTNTSLEWGKFPTLSQPGAISSAAAGYNSSRGIGSICTMYANADNRAFRRGGRWDSTTTAGILSLPLNYSTTQSSTDTGFRVTR